MQDEDNATTNAAPTGNGGDGVPATTAPASAVTAPPGTRLVHPLDRYLELEPGGGAFLLEGEFINFNGQSGEWSVGRGEDKRTIGATVPFIANLNGLAVGWIKMVDRKVAAREIGFVVDGYERLPREALDDRDQRRWRTNDRGEREDPWKMTAYLPMRSMEDDELYVFGPFAPTQLSAIKQFVTICRRTDRGGKDPIVLLESRSFKNQSGGTTYAPDLKIVGWDYWQAGIPAPEPQPIAVPLTAPTAPPPKPIATQPKRNVGDLDDEMPFD